MQRSSLYLSSRASRTKVRRRGINANDLSPIVEKKRFARRRESQAVKDPVQLRTWSRQARAQRRLQIAGGDARRCAAEVQKLQWTALSRLSSVLDGRTGQG